jgi:hypothetical protein
VSISSELHFVPIENPTWQPDDAFLRKVCQYIRVDSANALFADKNVRSPVENSAVYRLIELMPLDRVFDQIAELKALPLSKRPDRYWISMPSNEWGRAFSAAFEGIAEEIGGHFIPCDFSLVLGPKRLFHGYTEEDFGTYAFQLAIDGYGNAYGEDEYVRLALELEPVKALITFLEEQSGQKFGLFLTMA